MLAKIALTTSSQIHFWYSKNSSNFLLPTFLLPTTDFTIQSSTVLLTCTYYTYYILFCHRRRHRRT